MGSNVEGIKIEIFNMIIYISEGSVMMIKQYQSMFEDTILEFTRAIPIQDYRDVMINFVNVELMVNYDVRLYKLKGDIYVTKITSQIRTPK